MKTTLMIRLSILAVSALAAAFGVNRNSPSFPWNHGSSSHKADTPLRDVLPGRWKGEYKGQTYTINFGRHSEASVLVDVPFEYRARLGTDQLYIGGNYHVENDHSFNCQWTDGRWAEMLAQMGGMPLHHVGVKSYGENEFVDGEDVKWKCVSHAPAGNSGEARDIADQAPVINDAPRAKQPANPGGAVSTKTLYDQQQKLTVLYNQLETRRKKLNLKDKSAVAAFNKAAEDYSREVAALNSGNTANQPAPTPPPTATAR